MCKILAVFAEFDHLMVMTQSKLVTFYFYRASEWTYLSSRLVTAASTAATQSSSSTRQIFPSSYRALSSPISTLSHRWTQSVKWFIYSSFLVVWNSTVYRVQCNVILFWQSLFVRSGSVKKGIKLIIKSIKQESLAIAKTTARCTIYINYSP